MCLCVSQYLCEWCVLNMQCTFPSSDCALAVLCAVCDAFEQCYVSVSFSPSACACVMCDVFSTHTANAGTQLVRVMRKVMNVCACVMCVRVYVWCVMCCVHQSPVYLGVVVLRCPLQQSGSFAQAT